MVARPTDAGEWYLVVFRSVRKATASDERLTWFDDRAHEEAAASPGFGSHCKGPSRRIAPASASASGAAARRPGRRPVSSTTGRP